MKLHHQVSDTRLSLLWGSKFRGVKFLARMLRLITLAGIFLEAHAADAPDIPNVTCRRDNYGADNKTVKSSRGTSFTSTSRSGSTSVTRTFGITVELFSYKLPKAPYDVQCFFIARDEKTKQDYIYDTQLQTSSLISETLMFQAPVLQGTKTHTYVSGYSSGTSGFSSGPSGSVGTGAGGGSTYSTSTTFGSKTYGYVVRVLSQEKIVRIESDQAPLKIIAEKNPSIFDKVVKGLTANVKKSPK